MSRSMDDALTAYDFAAPPLIRFGAGRIDELGELVGLWGRRAWIVGGGRSLTVSGARQRIFASLAAAGIDARMVASSNGEPTVQHVATALAGLAHEDREGVVVVAVGGGATIDLAKAIAAMATNMPTDICSTPTWNRFSTRLSLTIWRASAAASRSGTGRCPWSPSPPQPAPVPKRRATPSSPAHAGDSRRACEAR
jgi:stage V sporulation protein SpoVS